MNLVDAGIASGATVAVPPSAEDAQQRMACF